MKLREVSNEKKAYLHGKPGHTDRGAQSLQGQERVQLIQTRTDAAQA